MTNYKKMYLKMFQASEEAINLLIAAQQSCEELYINQPDREVKALPPPSGTKNAGMTPVFKSMPFPPAKETEPS